MPYLVAFLAAACVVLWATPVVKAVGIRSGQLDFPDERKIHQQPMVRLGGGFPSFLGTWWPCCCSGEPELLGACAPSRSTRFGG